MKTSSFFSRVRNIIDLPQKRRRKKLWRDSSENLEARQLLTAGFMWDGDALQITGSEGDDFVAVQQDATGLRVFTEDGVFDQHEGRSFGSASGISVSGGAGNDVLFSYRSEIPVTLSGDAGHDFLYSDQSDAADGGAGFDWVYGTEPTALWENAFGVPGFDLTPEVLNGTPTFDGDGRIALQVDVAGELAVAGQELDVDGAVSVSADGVDVSVAANVDEWQNAFGIYGFDLNQTTLEVNSHSDSAGQAGYGVAFRGILDVADTNVSVQGDVSVQDDAIDAVFTGAIDEWDNAFGVPGLNLDEVQISGSTSTAPNNDQSLRLGIDAGLTVEGADIDVTGHVELSSDQIDAVFSGELSDWNDAFGVEDLNINDADVVVSAVSNGMARNELRVDIAGDIEFDNTNVEVSGGFVIAPDAVNGSLTGLVAGEWNDAFGITGLDLNDTRLAVQAARNDNAASNLEIDLASSLSIAGTSVAVTGLIDFDETGISGAFQGGVDGTWMSAFGINALNLQDTTFNITGTRSSNESDLSFDVASSLDLFGTEVTIGGLVEYAETGLRTNLTGTVGGGWVDALGIPGLSLRDTELSVVSDSSTADGTGFNITLDTDLQLFGRYIDVIGNLGVTPSGIDVSFTPPASLNFTDFLGIPGFTLENADLTVTADSQGLNVALASVIEVADVDVEFAGAVSVTRDEIQASLTGRVDHWQNAFDVPGLTLNDVVLSLGAESGPGGASMFVGLGAGIEIGSKELEVAGLLGFGTTGWEVAFRGSIDSLTGDDVIGFANTLNSAADPTAAEIQEGTLGDLALRDAYLNFAPKGGHAELGIADGFGIGGDFLKGGTLIASGEFMVDLQSGAFEVGLEVPQLELGPVELSNVIVDIRLAPQDSHYHVAGTAGILGAEVSVEGYVSSDNFLLRGSGSIEVGGIAADAEFTIDDNGIRFVASTNGGAINGVKDVVTRQIRAVADAAQTVIDKAQAAVDTARSAVVTLEAELAAARAEAQREVDQVKSKINAASAVVTSARASKDYWYKVKYSRYKAWRSAVATTNNAPWYKKAYYKAIEVGKYSSYAYAAARYSTQVAVYKVAVATHKALRDAAGWVLDSVGVEANPEVIRLKALLAVANVALDTTEAVLNGVEKANAAVFKALDIADSFRVDRITFSGKVSDLVNAGVGLRIDYTFAGNARSLEFDASTDNLADQLADRMLAIL